MADGVIIWQSHTLDYGNVGTPMFVHPRGAKLAEWGSFYGGDSQFARDTVALNPERELVFVDHLIADLRPLRSLKANRRIVRGKTDWSDGATLAGDRGREDCQWGWQNWVGEVFRECTILDVGAGLGHSRKRLAAGGNEVFLQDPAPELPVDIHDDMRKLPDRSFDVVTAFDVIEHVVDDDVFLWNACRVARRAVVITTPNHDISHAANPFHVREYTPAEFLELLEGLQITAFVGGNSPGTERVELSSAEFARHACWHQAAIIDVSE